MRLISTLSWAKRFVNLDGRRFDPSEWPQLTEIAETVDCRMGCTFVLRFPPQVFKSLFLQLRLLRSLAITPERSLWYCTNHEEAKAFSDSKLGPLVRAIQPILDKYPHDVDAQGGRDRFLFVDATVELLSADNKTHRNGKSGKDLYLDESWQYGAGHIAEIRARSDSYEDFRRILLAETAPNEDDESDRIFQRSPQRTWHLACIHCGKAFEPVWGDATSAWGMKWDCTEATKGKDGRWNETLAARTARYVCPHCERAIKYSSETLRLLNSPGRGARYVAKNDEADPKVEGWRANAICFRDWSGLVAEWLTACNAKRLGSLELIEEFTKKKLVVPWSPRVYLEQQGEYPIGEYDMWESWADEGKAADGSCRLRFVTVDVQQNCFWAVCRKWALDGRSRLHAYRKLLTQPEIVEFVKECEVPHPMVWVDSGYDPKDRAKGEIWGRTMKLCAEYDFHAANGIPTRQFLHEDGVRRMYSPPQYLDAWQGTAQMGTRELVTLTNYHSEGAKSMLQYLRNERHQPTDEPLWSFARDAGEEYRKQAYSEIQVRKRHPKGHFYSEWIQVYPENHIFDMECVQVVIANAFGVVGAGAVEAQTVDEAPKKEDGV